MVIILPIKYLILIIPVWRRGIKEELLEEPETELDSVRVEFSLLDFFGLTTEITLRRRGTFFGFSEGFEEVEGVLKRKS